MVSEESCAPGAGRAYDAEKLRRGFRRLHGIAASTNEKQALALNALAEAHTDRLTHYKPVGGGNVLAIYTSESTRQTEAYLVTATGVATSLDAA